LISFLSKLSWILWSCSTLCRRGLSKYYQGKSQSFTSLSRVASIEDLAKNETRNRRKGKASKSYLNGLDLHKSYTLPKPIIAKKVSRGSMPSLCFPGRRGSFLNSARPPPIPLHKKFWCITSQGCLTCCVEQIFFCV
jgi:hypothetical protein